MANDKSTNGNKNKSLTTMKIINCFQARKKKSSSMTWTKSFDGVYFIFKAASSSCSALRMNSGPFGSVVNNFHFTLKSERT